MMAPVVEEEAAVAVVVENVENVVCSIHSEQIVDSIDQTRYCNMWINYYSTSASQNVFTYLKFAWWIFETDKLSAGGGGGTLTSGGGGGGPCSKFDIIAVWFNILLCISRWYCNHENNFMSLNRKTKVKTNYLFSILGLPLCILLLIDLPLLPILLLNGELLFRRHVLIRIHVYTASCCRRNCCWLYGIVLPCWLLMHRPRHYVIAKLFFLFFCSYSTLH